MLRHFDETLKIAAQYEKDFPDRLSQDFNAQMYFDYWLAALNVVVEGFDKLGLYDDEVEALIRTSTRSTLLKYRSGIYHFREKYWDDDVLSLIRDKDAVEWCHNLNAALGRYLMGEVRKLMADDTFNPAEGLIIR